MYSLFQLSRRYLQYLLSASSGKGHGIHSPFVFDFITRVLNDKNEYPAYHTVEKLRNRLLQDPRVIEITDFGAGSSVSRNNQRSISSIAKHTAKSRKYGQLLFRMVKYYQPLTILELGSSLGITSAYLSLAKPDADFITMEGSEKIAAIAKLNFQLLALENIHLVEGHFDHGLPSVLKALSSVDFVFIDGNHRQEPTERYFHQLLPKRKNDSIFVLDDIHWSREMEAAWAAIKKHPAVTCSIDLFFMGIIFFRNEFKEKQHFVIRF